MNRQEYIRSIVPLVGQPKINRIEVFAPINIALIKYWGKRNKELMLPYNSSLSVTLKNYGTQTELTIAEEDKLMINGEQIDPTSDKSKKVFHFLRLFCGDTYRFHVNTINTIPTGSGLASSASAFASFAKAVNGMFSLDLSAEIVSHIARMGSVSAGRSLHQGFVLMKQSDICQVNPIATKFKDFCVGFCIVSAAEKKHTSRENMDYTVSNSIFYESWLQIVERDLQEILPYIQSGNFYQVGIIAERNALCMHASIAMLHEQNRFYLQSESLQLIQRAQTCRKDGLAVFCTVDAGPNVKLLFQEKDVSLVKASFPEMSFYENVF